MSTTKENKQNRKEREEQKMMKRYIVYAVCYRTKEGSSLAYICHTEKTAREAVEFINKNRPEKVPFTKMPIDWNSVKEFFINEQEEF